MTADVAVLASPPARRQRGVEAAIARRAFTQVWIGTTVCAVAFGLMIASFVLTYVSSFPTEASRQQLGLITTGQTGMSVLFGPAVSIETVGGYTVYKGFVLLTSIAAIWGVLTATRLLRGEEDAGRWQLVLAGSTGARRATAATLVALGAAVGVVLCGATLIPLLAGRDPDVGLGVGGTVLHGLSIALVPAVFVAVGAVTSQLGRTRRMASGLGLGVFGVAFVLRMIGDAGPGTHWLLWATPFGWSELVQPFTRNDPRPFVPGIVAVVGLCTTAIVLASRRDVGEGVLATRDISRLRPFGLGSVFGLAARLELPALAAWGAGVAATAFVYGVVARMTTASVPDSISSTLGRLGVQGTFVRQYFGVAFLMIGSVVALLPAGQLGAACDEETSRRLLHVLSRPPTRRAWFGGRLALAGAGVAAAGLLAGPAAWLGARTQGVDLGFEPMLTAGINLIPTALVVLGIGAVVLSLAPRGAAAPSVYCVVAWSLVAYLLGQMISGLGWLERLSVFHYMALAPAQDAAPRTLALTVGVALVLCAVATSLFDRRDVRTG